VACRRNPRHCAADSPRRVPFSCPVAGAPQCLRAATRLSGSRDSHKLPSSRAPSGECCVGLKAHAVLPRCAGPLGRRCQGHLACVLGHGCCQRYRPWHPGAPCLGKRKVPSEKRRLVRKAFLGASRSREPALACRTRTCYLVDPASSHMLVSKIKPCMCKYELIRTVKLRMAH
jgi:hypothetical protein